MHQSRRALLTFGTVILLVAALAAPAAAARLAGSDHGGMLLQATLSGANEVPGPGDPDGSGTAWITLNYGQREICWNITVTNITLPATGAHIHNAPAGSAAGVFVGLSAPGSNGTSQGCTTTTRANIDAIRDDPAAFYVNVHTVPLYAAGAVRGQLGR